MSRASLLQRVKSWLRATVGRRRFEADMADEIRFHMDEHTRVLMEKGVPADEAYRQARIAFGGSESSRDGVRSAVGLRPLDELLADLRYAFRVLRNSPGFTAVAAGSLALAIGANTTIFSVSQHMLLQRLAVPHAEDLRILYHEDGKHSVFHSFWGSWFKGDTGLFNTDAFTYPVFQQMQQKSRSRGGPELFGFKDIGSVNLAQDAATEPGGAEAVTGNFFQGMGATAELGRAIQPSDDGAPGTGAVAVLSYSYWQRAFGGSPGVLGRTVRVDTFPLTIVGVSARGFTGAAGLQTTPDVFVPMSMIATLHGTSGEEHLLTSTDLSWIQIMLRKPVGMSDAALEQQLAQDFTSAVLATVQPAKGESIPKLRVQDGSHGTAQGSSTMRKPLYVLLVLVGGVLLLACANIANLMLTRAETRHREISVRLALGAGRTRIFRQLLVEALLLAVLGGCLGLALGFAGTRAAGSLLHSAWETGVVPIPFQWPVFAFTGAITIVTGVLFGIAPAWRSMRTDVNTALKQGARSASRQRRVWTSKGLVGFQMAMATLLVAGSALFLRSMRNLTEVPLGFDSHGVLLFDMRPTDAQFDGRTSMELHRAMRERFAAIPGVQQASYAGMALVADSMWSANLSFEGQPPAPRETDAPGQMDQDHSSYYAPVSPDFLSLLRIPIIAGRDFSLEDTSTTPRVAVVTQAFARAHYGTASPLGRRFTVDSLTGKKPPRWTTIVGVCGDVQYSDLRTEKGPVYFTNMAQWQNTGKSAQSATYLLRLNVPYRQVLPSLQHAAHTIAPDVPLMYVRTQDEQVAAITQQERLIATLTTAFGALALMLACVGIYGIMAYTVSQRTHEIGIRLALGAERSRVRRMVLREATWLACGGVAVGLLAALALARAVKSLLYNLHPNDPLSLSLAALLLLTVALASSWLPAARAARLEPMIALRQD